LGGHPAAALEAPAVALLAAERLGVRAGGRELVRDLGLALAAGEFVALLGRNGSGKTLTLHTLAGLRAPAAGRVTLAGTPMQGMRRRAIAQRVGLLPQEDEEGFATTVLEAVLLGRHPHLPAWRWQGAEDERLAREALRQVGLQALEARSTATLSGGEARRVAIATLLAQEPGVFILDEPTNHLDPHHQLAMLALFRGLADGGRAVLATLHDPTLAARFADRAVLLFGDGRWLAGPAREVLTAPVLSELYLTRIEAAEVAGRRVFVSA
jgi:iron complex transport system ATP-binding protein